MARGLRRNYKEFADCSNNRYESDAPQCRISPDIRGRKMITEQENQLLTRICKQYQNP